MFQKLVYHRNDGRDDSRESRSNENYYLQMIEFL